jgi:hypothetical protein
MDREEWRANVLTYDPDGKNKRVYASGIRNCSGLTVQPGTGVVYCATNERDLLGDNLPPDYATSVKQGRSTAGLGTISATMRTSVPAAAGGRISPTRSPCPMF